MTTNSIFRFDAFFKTDILVTHLSNARRMARLISQRLDGIIIDESSGSRFLCEVYLLREFFVHKLSSLSSVQGRLMAVALTRPFLKHSPLNPTSAKLVKVTHTDDLNERTNERTFVS